MTQEFSRSKWGSLKLLRIWCPQDVVGIGAEPIVLSYTVLAHTCDVFVLVLLVLLSSLLFSGYLYLFVMFHNCYLLLVLWHHCYGYYCYCYLLLFVTPTIGAETEAARRSWRKWETGDERMRRQLWAVVKRENGGRSWVNVETVCFKPQKSLETYYALIKHHLDLPGVVALLSYLVLASFHRLCSLLFMPIPSWQGKSWPEKPEKKILRRQK